MEAMNKQTTQMHRLVRTITIPIRHCATAQLTLVKVPITTAADDGFDFFFIFHRRGVLADDSYEMSRLVFSKQQKNKTKQEFHQRLYVMPKFTK